MRQYFENSHVFSDRLKLPMLMCGSRSSTGRVPDRRVSDREGPSAVCAQPVSWTSRWWRLKDGRRCRAGTIRHWRAAVRWVLRCFAVLASVRHDTELVNDPPRNVKPVRRCGVSVILALYTNVLLTDWLTYLR